MSVFKKKKLDSERYVKNILIIISDYTLKI